MCWWMLPSFCERWDLGKSDSSGSDFVEERFEDVFGVVCTAGVVTETQCSSILSSLAGVAALVLLLRGIEPLLLLLMCVVVVALAAVVAVLIASWMTRSCLLEGTGESSSVVAIGVGDRGVCVHGPCDAAGAENRVLHSGWSVCCSGCGCWY